MDKIFINTKWYPIQSDNHSIMINIKEGGGYIKEGGAYIISIHNGFYKSIRNGFNINTK